MKRGAFLLLALTGSGCAFATAESVEQATNACTTNSTCGANGVCASVGTDHVCLATSSDLGQVVLEVRPTPDVNGNVVSHVFTDKLTLSGSLSADPQAVDLAVPANVTFSGQLFGPTTKDKCTGPDGSLPVKVELHAVTQYPLLTSTYNATASQASDGTWSYSLSVPAGTYDVYLTPQPVTLPLCGEDALPPRLVSGVDVSTNVKFSSAGDGLARVYGTLAVPKDRSVGGWHIEVVDPTYGFVISDSPPLPDPAVGATSVPILGGPNGDDPQGLRYYGTANPIIRCRDQTGALVVHWTLAGVDALGTGNVSLDLNDLLANPTQLFATVVDDQDQGVAASITVQSQFLTGDTKSQASFRMTAQADATGQFNASLVPGTYSVLVSPTSDTTVTTASGTWTVTPQTLHYGKTFQLDRRPLARGTVITPAGMPVMAIPVVATAHPADLKTYFDAFSSAASLVARDENVTTDQMGAFSFPIDPVTIDFSVRPDAASRFAWNVIPGLLVTAASVAPVDDLHALTLASPVLVSGTVTSPDGAVPSAVVRAYIPVAPADKTAPSNLVQIGETVADANGHYELPLPATVSQTASP